VNEQGALCFNSSEPRGITSVRVPAGNLSIYRVQLVCDSSMKVKEGPVNDARSAATLVREYLKGVDREHAVVLLLARISHRGAKRERADARRYKAREEQSAQAYSTACQPKPRRRTVRRALFPSVTP
jgi:hypothetical protein